MPDDEDPLAALRELAAEREADERAEQAARPASELEQAGLAIEILETDRAWRIEDRRALGLPRTADDASWRQVVEQRLRELDGAVVVDRWLAFIEAGGDGRKSRAPSAAAFSQLPSIAPVADRVRALLGQSSLVHDVLLAAPPDAAMREMLARALGTDMPVPAVEAALRIAASMATRDPTFGALIANRARSDRELSRAFVRSSLTLTELMARKASDRVLADAVVKSGCAALGATAMLELESLSPGRIELWAKALVAVAGDTGVRHLERMLGRPGWGSLLGPIARASDPLADLMSPIADVRRRALGELADRPDPSLLMALLLAVELDQHLARHVYKMRWRSLRPTPWLEIMTAHAEASSSFDEMLARTEPGNPERSRLPEASLPFRDRVAAVRAQALMDELIESGAARGEMRVPQRLTPALRELATQGVQAIAAALATPPLSDEERAELEQLEASFAATA